MLREYPDLEALFSGEGWEAPMRGCLASLKRLPRFKSIVIREEPDAKESRDSAIPVVFDPDRGLLAIDLPERDREGPRRKLEITLDPPPAEDSESFLLLLGWALRNEAERDAAVRDLRRLEAESRERDQERERWLRFFQVTVHDLKAPVSAVLNYLKTVLRKSQQALDERLVHMLRRSIIRLDGMLDLISGLLELARLESGIAEEPSGPVDLESLLSGCSELAHELAMPKDIRVSMTAKRPLPALHGSELRLNQMLMNLLTNAVKYTGPGGKVMLRAAREGDDLVLTVEDDGIGIPPEHLPRVFEEFYRVDSGESGGTGLGLSIARRIAEMHGGSITLQSPVTPDGRGTRATVRLPLGGAAAFEENKDTASPQ